MQAELGAGLGRGALLANGFELDVLGLVLLLLYGLSRRVIPILGDGLPPGVFRGGLGSPKRIGEDTLCPAPTENIPREG